MCQSNSYQSVSSAGSKPIAGDECVLAQRIDGPLGDFLGCAARLLQGTRTLALAALAQHGAPDMAAKRSRMPGVSPANGGPGLVDGLWWAGGFRDGRENVGGVLSGPTPSGSGCSA